MSMLKKSTEHFLAQALAIETDQVTSADIGFMARALVLCTMPHSMPKGNEFRRQNGEFLLTMYSPHGLPYGTLPRLLLAWIVTEAVRTQSRTLTLGRSLSCFLRELGLSKQGGQRGDITRLKEQMKRLFGCYISCNFSSKDRDTQDGFKIVQRSDLWWNPHDARQPGLWESTLTLSEEFYREITAKPIPLDMRALKALKRSPMALDVYMWLTFRFSYLKRTTTIPWEGLQQQFGAEYTRTVDFKIAFKGAVRKVMVVYSAAKAAEVTGGLMLSPSTTHIPRSKKKPVE